MYDIVSNYASNMATFYWDCRQDEDENEFDREATFKSVTKLVSTKTAVDTMRRLFNEGATHMMLKSEDMDRLEAWERDNAQWLVFVYEGFKVDDSVTPFAVLTKNEVQW